MSVDNPQINNNQQSAQQSIENQQNVQKTDEKEGKKRKRKKEDDTIVLAVPEAANSLSVKILNAVLAVLKEEDLVPEKKLIMKIIARDPAIKEYYMRVQDLAYIRFVLWSLAKQKIILKAKIYGDRKHVYYLLPEKLEKFKNYIIKGPNQ